MATYTAEEVREAGNLIGVDELEGILAASEPLEAHEFVTGTAVDFEVGSDWNDDFAALGADDPVNARVKLGAPGAEQKEFTLTRDALLEATSVPGLDKGYVSRSPASLTQAALKHWFRGGLGERAFKLLTAGPDQNVVGVTRATITPFSNLELLGSVKEAVETKYGADTQLLADPKVYHNLRRTDFRVVIPEDKVTIQSARHSADNPDDWAGGIHLHNSLIGETQTAVEAYLFAFWCTNGCITEHANSGTWNRKSKGQNALNVYEWAKLSTAEALNTLHHQFEMVDAMKDQPLEGDVTTVLRDIFETHGVPVAARKPILESMADTSDVSAYQVMQAITQAANDPTIPAKHAEKLMRVGGLLPAVAHKGRCDSCHRLQLN